MLVLSTPLNGDDNTYNVQDYGAVADGTTDNTQVQSFLYLSVFRIV